jgi:xyloglucan-specific endo-beta-1,4-glucanase
MASSNRTEFEGDLSPLVHYIWRHGMVLASNYVGVIQFGTEQKFATSNVTFTVNEFSMNVTRGEPKEAAASIMRLPCMELVYTAAMFIAAINIWFAS